MKTFNQLRFELEEVAARNKFSEYAHAITNGKNRTNTSFGSKTVMGIHNMLSNTKASEHEIADSIMNGKRKINTSYGTKTKEGIADMVKRHREAGHKTIDESVELDEVIGIHKK